jgi:hypothetical protein
LCCKAATHVRTLLCCQCLVPQEQVLHDLSSLFRMVGVHQSTGTWRGCSQLRPLLNTIAHQVCFQACARVLAGGTPKTTGIWYDDSYDRSLSPALDASALAQAHNGNKMCSIKGTEVRAQVRAGMLCRHRI